jgi:hypothetical protein
LDRLSGAAVKVLIEILKTNVSQVSLTISRDIWIYSVYGRQFLVCPRILLPSNLLYFILSRLLKVIILGYTSTPLMLFVFTDTIIILLNQWQITALLLPDLLNGLNLIIEVETRWHLLALEVDRIELLRVLIYNGTQLTQMMPLIYELSLTNPILPGNSV